MAVHITPTIRATGFQCCGQQTLVQAPRGFPTRYRFECGEHGFYPSTFAGAQLDKHVALIQRRRAKTVNLGGAPGYGRPWTNEEDDAVLEHAETNMALGLRIRRSESAIQKRRSYLLGKGAAYARD